MKKSLTYIVSAILLMAAAISCSVKDISSSGDEAASVETIELKAAINMPDETRTGMVKTSQGTFKNIWCESDCIGVFVDKSSKCEKFVLQEGAGMNVATFVGPAGGTSYQAVYPYSSVIGYEGGRICLSLPEHQKYAPDSFGTDANPMISSSTGDLLVFKNLCSIIKVSLFGSHIVKSLVFTANNNSCKVSGPAFVNPDNGQMVMDDNASPVVTLLVDDVLLNPEKATDFYIVLPAQTYKGGFSITVNTLTGSMTKSTSADVSLMRSQVHSLTPYQVKNDIGIDPSAGLEGKGNEASPYLIKNDSDFALFYENLIKYSKGEKSSISNLMNASYLLMDDMDLSLYCGPEVGSWTPIGDYGNNTDLVFEGVFDGGGHTLHNLYIGPTNKCFRGLFGYLAGTVRNLSVDGMINVPEVSNLTDIINEYVGCIAAVNIGTIENCTNYAEIHSNSCYQGGIAGSSSGVIASCVNSGKVLSGCGYTNASVGGIVGEVTGGAVYDCVNTGEVMGDSSVGAIAGYITGSGELLNCLNLGLLYSKWGDFYNNIGGVTGCLMDGARSMANCVNLGVIRDMKCSIGYPGAICGYAGAPVENCYWLYDQSDNTGMEHGFCTENFTPENCFPLSLRQITGQEDYPEVLYMSKDNSPSYNIIDALNNWAYDNSSEKRVLSGWEFQENVGHLALTGHPAEFHSTDASDVFTVSPAELKVSSLDCKASVKVTCGTGCKVVSLPQWMKLDNYTSETYSNGLSLFEYVFSVEANPYPSSRDGNVIFCNDDQKQISVAVVQDAKSDASEEWMDKEFYHSSLGMRFTGTWCPACPPMNAIFNSVEEKLGDKFLPVSVHYGDDYNSDCGIELVTHYSISSYPTAIIDYRAKVSYANQIEELIKEIESAHRASSGVRFSSSISGNSISVNLYAYFKDAGNYKVNVFILEDNLIGFQEGDEEGLKGLYRHDDVLRLALSASDGDPVSFNSDNYAWHHTYTGTLPSNLHKDNLKVLVFIQKQSDPMTDVKNVHGADYSGMGLFYVDNCRMAPAGETAELKFATDDGDDGDIDYSRDGELSFLQRSSVGQGVDIVITGDAFSDVDQKVFDIYASRAATAFFAVEPYASLKNRFNIMKVNAVSESGNVSVIDKTKFHTRFGAGTLVEGDYNAVFSFVRNSIPDIDFTKTLVIVLVNANVYAGTNHCWDTNESICFVPLQTSEVEFDETLRHEAAGHGFGKLDDEYGGGGIAPADWKDQHAMWFDWAYGFWENIDFNSTQSTVKWSKFIKDEHYQGQVGIYEGGGTYDYGVFRPSLNSIMRYNTGCFNAPSREAIYKKIMLFSEGQDWRYDFDAFVQFDEIGRNQEQSAYSTTYSERTYRDFVPLHTPVMHKR